MRGSEKMKVVGVDIGLEGLSVAVYEWKDGKRGFLVLEKEKIKSVVFKGSEGETVQDWVKRFGRDLENVIKGADLVVVERPPVGVRGRGWGRLFEWVGVVGYVAGKQVVSGMVEVSWEEARRFATNNRHVLKSDLKKRLEEEFGISGLSEDEANAVWLVYLGVVLLEYKKKGRGLSNIEMFRKKVIESFFKKKGLGV